VLLLHSRNDFPWRHSEFAYPFSDRTLREDESRFDNNAHCLCSASALEKHDFTAPRYPAEYFLVLALLWVPHAAWHNRVTYDYRHLGTFYNRYPWRITGEIRQESCLELSIRDPVVAHKHNGLHGARSSPIESYLKGISEDWDGALALPKAFVEE
jgi:hypothetical protein